MGRDPTRVFVVDDHAIYRCGLMAVLAQEPRYRWVGEAPNGPDAVRLAPAERPDLVLMDIAMPGMSGIATMAALRETLPTTRFVMLTCRLDGAELRQAYSAGANCVLSKTCSAPELLTAMDAAQRGQRLYNPVVADAIAAGNNGPRFGADLTARERKLLSLMARGLANREIGRRMDIAMPTVKFHVTNILAKLNADNRTSAVLAALKHELVVLD